MDTRSDDAGGTGRFTQRSFPGPVGLGLLTDFGFRLPCKHHLNDLLHSRVINGGVPRPLTVLGIPCYAGLSACTEFHLDFAVPIEAFLMNPKSGRLRYKNRTGGHPPFIGQQI